MAKWTNDATDLGCSRMPTLVLGWGKFRSPEEERLKTIHAIAGVETIEAFMNTDAIERGNRLEGPLGDWAVDKIKALADDTTEVSATAPDQGFFIDNLPDGNNRLGASLDLLLHIDGEVFFPTNDGDFIQLSGHGPLEIKTTSADSGEPDLHMKLQGYGQCLCGGWEWFIIAKLGKDLKFTLWPYRYSEIIGEQILDATRDFWRRVKEDDPYPDLPRRKMPETKLLESNLDIADLCNSYLAVQAEQKELKTALADLRVQIEGAMTQAEAEVAEAGSYRIEWIKSLSKAKPAETTEAKPAMEKRTFKIKEIQS